MTREDFTDAELTKDECIEKGDEMYIQSEEGVIVVDHTEEETYRFYGGEKKLTETREDEQEEKEVDVLLIPYEQHTKYQTSSKYNEVDPVTKSELSEVLVLYRI